MELARSRLGAPYVWAAEGPWAFDCSGLVTWIYRQMGTYVPHQSGMQYWAATRVPFSQAQPGDAVFWGRGGGTDDIYHVAIYIGNNQVIHAPQPGKNVMIADLYNWHNLLPYVGRY